MKNTKDAFMQSYGNPNLALIAFDDKYALYADSKMDSLTTIRRDKKKLSKRDKREADALIDLLFAKCEVGNA